MEWRKIAPRDIVLFGESLGGAVAAWLAGRVTPRALVLASTFTSMPDLGAQVYPFLPVRLISRFSYDNLAALKAVKAPVLVAHSRDDDIIPFSHGKALFEAAGEPKQFLEMRGGHNDAFLFVRQEWTAQLAAFLERAGYTPDAMDISVESFDVESMVRARFVGISVPMHTALRLGVRVAEQIRQTNPTCHICLYGLYASLNAEYVLEHVADSVIGGECETPLLGLIQALEEGRPGKVEGVYRRGQPAGPFLKRLPFPVPSRGGLPALAKYARLERDGVRGLAGYVKPAAGGCTCASTALSPRFTEAGFSWSRRTLSWTISGGWFRPALPCPVRTEETAAAAHRAVVLLSGAYRGPVWPSPITLFW